MTSPIIHPINEKKPEFPCELFSEKGNRWDFYNQWPIVSSPEAMGYTKWRSPLPPEVTPEQGKGETLSGTFAEIGDAALAEARYYREMLELLHDCNGGTTDAEGYEWGIYRVKWENGQPVSVMQTLSDFSDLRAEMVREKDAKVLARIGLKPTPPPTSGPSPAALAAAKEIAEIPVGLGCKVGDCNHGKVEMLAAIIDRKFPREEQK